MQLGSRGSSATRHGASTFIGAYRQISENSLELLTRDERPDVGRLVGGVADSLIRNDAFLLRVMT